MRLLLPILALASCLSAGPMQALVTATLTLTPGQNALAVSSVHSSNGPSFGASVTQWTGTITVQLDDAFSPTTLTIVSADLVAQISGTYFPAPGGQLGNAPANYAFSYPNVQPYFGLVAAIRDERGSLGSGPLALSGSAGGYSFSPAGVTFNTDGRVDHRAADANGGFANGFSVALANAATTSGALSLNGSALSLQLPLDATFALGLTTGSGSPRGGLTFHFTGTLNATGVIPEPSTWALALAGAALLGLAARGRARA